MNIEQLPTDNSYIVTGYGEGFFVINQKKICTHILMSRDKIFQIAEIDKKKTLSIEDVGYSKNNDWILLIGVGATYLDFPKKTIELYKRKYDDIPIEIMDTGAACRTYNILISENRNVIAILYKYE